MGLPVIISSYVPGQERGNVVYTIQSNAGVYAPTVERVVASIRFWLDNPKEMDRIAGCSKKLAHPEAASDIAKILVNWIR
jgi:1,2-diacylglycerol 3-beta-galactosyltransferase